MNSTSDSENNSGYIGIKKLVEIATVAAYVAGVPTDEAISAAIEFEARLTSAYGKSEKRRRFLQRCKTEGAASVADAEKVSKHAIWKRRRKYLNQTRNQIA